MAISITDSNGIEIGYGDPAVAQHIVEVANRVMVMSDSTWNRNTMRFMRPFWRSPRIRATMSLDASPGLAGQNVRFAAAASALGGTVNYSPYLSSYEQSSIASAVADTTWSANRLMQTIFRGHPKPAQPLIGRANNTDCFSGDIIGFIQVNGGRLTFEYLAHPLGEPQSIFFVQILSDTFTTLATSATFSTHAAANEIRTLTIDIPPGWSGFGLYFVARQVGLSAGTSGRFLVGLRVSLEDLSTVNSNLVFDVVASGGETVGYYNNTANLSAFAWSSINSRMYDAFIVGLGINGFTDAGRADFVVEYQLLIDKIRAVNPTLPIAITSQLRLINPPVQFLDALKEIVDDNPNTVLLNTRDMVPSHSVVFQGWTDAWQTGSFYKLGDMVLSVGIWYVFAQGVEAASTIAPASSIYHVVDNPTGQWVRLQGSPGQNTISAAIGNNAFYGDTIHPGVGNFKVYGQIINEALNQVALAAVLNEDIDLTPAALAQVVSAINVSTTGVNAATAATQATTAATEIGKVHRSATAVAAGAAMRRNAVAVTATTLDETLAPTT